MKFEDWKSFKLGEIAKIQTGPFGSQLHVIDYTETGVPVVMPINLGNEKIIIDKMMYVSQEKADSLSRHKLNEGDIIFSRRGDVERHAFVHPANKGWLCGTGCLKLTFQKKNLSRFVSYQLMLQEKKLWLSNHAVGTTMPNLNTSILSNLEIKLPDIETQTRIAAILTSLDDKIELNRQMNTTLEGIAQTLFQEMCLPKAGERMEGWREGRFEDVSVQVKANLNPSQSPQKLFNHYSLPAFDNGEVPALDLGETIMSNKTMVKKYSVLFSKLNPRIPRIWSIGNIEPSISICSTEFVGFVPKDASYYSFINYFLKQSEIINKLISHATGTSSSHQRVKPADILILPIMIPPDELLQRFDRIVKPLLEKKFSNLEETQTLTTLRDSLLPKLMRGELLI